MPSIGGVPVAEVPVVLTVTLLPRPIVNVALAAVVKTGVGCTTVKVKVLEIEETAELLAVNVKV